MTFLDIQADYVNFDHFENLHLELPQSEKFSEYSSQLYYLVSHF